MSYVNLGKFIILTEEGRIKREDRQDREGQQATDRSDATLAPARCLRLPQLYASDHPIVKEFVEEDRIRFQKDKELA